MPCVRSFLFLHPCAMMWLCSLYFDCQRRPDNGQSVRQSERRAPDSALLCTTAGYFHKDWKGRFFFVWLLSFNELLIVGALSWLLKIHWPLLLKRCRCPSMR